MSTPLGKGAGKGKSGGKKADVQTLMVCEFVFAHLDYSRLLSCRGVCEVMLRELQGLIARRLGVTPSRVEVELSPGTVSLCVKVTTPDAAEAANAKGKVDCDQDGFLRLLEEHTQRIPGVRDAATTGPGLGVSGLKTSIRQKVNPKGRLQARFATPRSAGGSAASSVGGYGGGGYGGYAGSTVGSTGGYGGGYGGYAGSTVGGFPGYAGSAYAQSAFGGTPHAFGGSSQAPLRETIEAQKKTPTSADLDSSADTAVPELGNTGDSTKGNSALLKQADNASTGSSLQIEPEQSGPAPVSRLAVPRKRQHHILSEAQGQVSQLTVTEVERDPFVVGALPVAPEWEELHLNAEEELNVAKDLMGSMLPQLVLDFPFRIPDEENSTVCSKAGTSPMTTARLSEQRASSKNAAVSQVTTGC